MSTRTRIVLVGVAVVILVVGFVLASGSDDEGAERADDPPAAADSTPAPAPAGTTTATTPAQTATEETAPAAPEVPTIVVEGAKPQGGVRRLTFDKGETIRFRVRSDVSDEIHVHGYDVAKDVEAGGSVSFSIPAKIDGRFEVELESRGEQIAELEVEP